MDKLFQVSAVLALVVNCASGIPLFGVQTPKSYVAFGDSFSSGIGSGVLVDKNVACQRQTGSYPRHLLKSNPFLRDQLFKYVSCAGNKLADIDNQIAELANKKYDLATISIGGNDFHFGAISSACIYQVTSSDVTDPQKLCDDALDLGFAQLSNSTVRAAFYEKFDRIQSDVLNVNGRMYVANYPKFFARPREGDACDSISFFPIAGMAALNMTAANRRRVNELTNKVNELIEKVVGKFGNRVEFIDWDSLFEGKRFCEPKNSKDPIGANNPDVFFNDLTTTLESPRVTDASQWTPGLKVNISDTVQQNSAFHPKAGGHRALAAKLTSKIHSRLMQFNAV
ncbi:uncharacterized protein L3040_008732 [Drepanopeziza brunnea f. sp. 'multigermtubi']|uniref:Esterase n=1 Tax=Marssonina brunnea f. sp. multigermtubi (strain MB_m1) TaxID=1072389 RepID=K1X181_MARBU|nr:esterase [Drepanopeziza brunnea f. sp. 'multigermtubi' MB_m1]EKD18767.1 esterase [Drepanopeziza brunnea f. sp. 'multigermtubi' MB_m1]KAJ5033620.1 hypothetical protein L3040_008732 [Drepanopeziza brunnea f. sp. 'multigermtubi']